jgi:hypothetical protein
VVLAVGPVFGKLPDGKMGYLDDLTSERVDAQGVTNVATALKSALPLVLPPVGNVQLALHITV